MQLLAESLINLGAEARTDGEKATLYKEALGYAIMTEIPCVIVNVMRGGPSTGLPTLPAQGDVMQARWGSHGDMEAIALCPSTVQECLDMTIESFNLSEKYRMPVFLMRDEVVETFRNDTTVRTWAVSR